MDLRHALEHDVLVCDGAMGTMLHSAGNSLDQALPALNLTDPALVRTVHDSYVDAGVDVIQTNTFGASRLRLSAYGFGERVAEINQAGVRLAREAVRAAPHVLVAGSVSPAVSVQQRRRVSGAERADALREQIGALAAAGVDLMLLETFGYVDELVEAVQVAVELCDLPVIAQATFRGVGHTLSGHTPRDLVRALAGAPIAALGLNCTLGPQRALAVLRELREHTDLPLTAQPNAGLPRRVSSARFEYDVDAEYFTGYIRRLLDAGARIVGGCCGTTPAQLASAVQAAKGHRQRTETRAALVVAPRPAEPPPPVPAEPGSFAEPGQFIVELASPPSGGVEECLDVARRLVDGGIRQISVVSSPRVTAQVNPVDLALHLHLKLGIDTLAGVTTWDRTIMALQADLLGAHTLGLRRVVCETGSPPLLGDYPHVDGVWQVDSLGLIELLAGLNDGEDYYGLPLTTQTEFEIGARINPGSRDPEAEADRAARKIEAGARFLATRPVYDPADLRRLLDLIAARVSGQDVPVLATVRPLTGFPEAELLAHEVPDVRIPARTLNALRDAGDGHEVGLELARELVSQVKDMVHGIVLLPTANPVATVHGILAAT